MRIFVTRVLIPWTVGLAGALILNFFSPSSPRARAADVSVPLPERVVLAADMFAPWTDGNRAGSRLPGRRDVTANVSDDVVSRLRTPDGEPFGTLPMEPGWSRYEGVLAGDGETYIVVTAGERPDGADAPYPYPMVRETMTVTVFENEKQRAAYRLRFMKLWDELTTFPPNPAEMEPGFERVQVYTNRQVRFSDAWLVGPDGARRHAFVYAMRRC